MATPFQPLAKCVYTYLYGIGAELLSKLRAIIEKVISLIDAQILLLRAMIAQYDYVKIFQEKYWNVAKDLIENFKQSVLAGIPGPADDMCPEFYHYLVDPAIGILDAFMSAFNPLADRLFDTFSVIAYFDRLIAYWEGAKATLLSLLDAVDDAWFLATEQAGNMIP
jgi:hypothetical protein